jgi:Xaa-Pro dipeptidase
MSRHDFPPEEFSARRAALFAAMARRGLSSFLVFHPTSIHWLTGCEAKGYQAFQCLLVDAAAQRLVLFTRESERHEVHDEALVDDLVCWGGAQGGDPIDAFVALARSLRPSTGGALGMEVPAYYLHPHHYVRIRAALKIGADGEVPNLVHELRLVKSPREIACLREAARIADLCLAGVRDTLAAGRTEREVAGAIYGTALAHGADVPTVPVNFVAGPRAAYSHGGPTSRRLEAGDTGNVEFCIPFQRHTVSLGRVFSLGPPGERLRELHDVVRRAADACIAVIRDGTPAAVAHRAASEVIDAAGFRAHRAHTLGYAVAPAFPPATGEPLQLAEGSSHGLQAGMLLSICPNIFIGQERLGARLVDNVLVTSDGAEILSTLPRDVVVVA